MQVVADDPLPFPQPTRHAGAKMTPQEVKAFPACTEIDHPGLIRVQVQTQPAQQGRGPGMSLFGLFHGPADHHEVIRVADQLPGALLGPGSIERVQVNVGQQRGNDATNAMGNFSFEVTLGYRRLEKPRRSRQRVTDDM